MNRARKLLQADVSVREAIVMALQDAGIDTVFGIPGGHTGAIFDALYDHPAIRTVLVRQESLAGIMAQVYGRLTGQPGVAVGQAAFLLGASAGALEAHLSAYPLVLLTDISVEGRFAHHGAYQSGSGEYGSWDARAAYAGITSRTMVAHGGAQSVQTVQLAIKHATTGAGGSVAVLLPLESMRGRIGPGSVPAIYATSHPSPPASISYPDGAALDRAAGLLATAQRPVLIAGNGIHRSRAYDELQQLAEAFSLPVVTTAGGKSAIAENHPLALGVFGNFGGPAANAAVADADVLLVIGSKLAPSDTANENPALIDPTRQAIIQADIEPRHVDWTYPAAETLIGDAATTMRLLAQSGPGTPAALAASRAQLVTALRAKHGYFRPDDDGTEPPEMPALIGTLAGMLPASALVCADAGENRIFLTHHYQTKSAGSFIQPAGLGAMGYALPAAMAAKLACPGQVAVAVCGDGGFAMSMNGLLTAVEENIPVIVIVLNNSCLGWVYHGQRNRHIASEFGEFNYAAIAREMGCRSFRATSEDEFSAAISAALTETRPVVIEAVVGRKQTFLDVTSPLVGWKAG